MIGLSRHAGACLLVVGIDDMFIKQPGIKQGGLVGYWLTI